MTQTDLILLHAPSVMDFRKHAALFGPVSDVVPSTQVFEMYPVGFLTMLEYLERHGLSARIINVALKMLRSKRFDPERLIESLRPAAFGIDLHWLVHAQGSLELAGMIKRHHPDIPVIFGGLSSSYFHEELIRYPQVDYVIRGDCAEEPLRQLLEAIKSAAPLETVPNLTWKDRDGRVHANAMAHVPAELTDGSAFDYRKIVQSSARHLDLMGHLPFLSWLSYPIVAGLSCRGCVHNCVTCGGSASAYQRMCGRNTPAFRGPELLARDIGTVSHYIKAPVMVLGDLLQAGPEFAERFLDALARRKVRNHIAIELFAPPPREFLVKAAKAIPNLDIQISPESHDEKIRRAFGKPYDNASLERFIADALDLGCSRIDIFFMIGLPYQTPSSVRETVQYCDALLERFGRGNPGRLRPFISPLAPFLDPGSRAFEEPERYGYRLIHRTLEEHRQALLAPSWKYTLNYETVWMSRDDLVQATYDAALGLNRVKLAHGLLDGVKAGEIEQRIEREWEMVRAIDAVCQISDVAERDARTRQIVQQYRYVGLSTICTKTEMNWPMRFIRFDVPRMLRALLAR